MLAVTRKNQIKEILNEKKSITVSEIAKVFSVTEETIRRDLKSLEDEGFLTRAYGGAFIQSGAENIVDISLRKVAYTDSKAVIAKCCASIIKNGDSIFLDPSTTASFIAKEITNLKLTVVTNSVLIVNQLVNYDNIKLVGIGGTYSSLHQAFLGNMTFEQIKNLYIDKAFISARTLSMENGITDSCEDLAVIRKAVINRCNEPYFVADYSKFDKTSFIKICDISDVCGIITDKTLTRQWQEYLDSVSTKYIHC